MSYRKFSKHELEQAIEDTKAAHKLIEQCLDGLPEELLNKSLIMLAEELPDLLDDIEKDLDKLTRALHKKSNETDDEDGDEVEDHKESEDIDDEA